MLDTIRAFIAVNLEVAVMRKVASLQKNLRTHATSSHTDVAWVCSPNLRLNLRSLGTIDRALTPALGDRLRAFLADAPPMRLRLSHVSAFPDPEHARLILIDVTDPPEALQDLARKLDDLAESFGLPTQPQPFRPHIVLGRMAQPTDVSSWSLQAEGTVGEARVVDCTLYDGTMHPPGLEFAVLQRVALGAMGLRSQRPPRASRHPSQRPKRSRAPGGAEVAAQPIPPPPRVPSFAPPTPAASAEAPEPSSAQAPADSPPQSVKPKGPSLPPALVEALPPDEDWG